MVFSSRRVCRFVFCVFRGLIFFLVWVLKGIGFLDLFVVINNIALFGV